MSFGTLVLLNLFDDACDNRADGPEEKMMPNESGMEYGGEFDFRESESAPRSSHCSAAEWPGVVDDDDGDFPFTPPQMVRGIEGMSATYPNLKSGASNSSAGGGDSMAISDVPHEVLLPCPLLNLVTTLRDEYRALANMAREVNADAFGIIYDGVADRINDTIRRAGQVATPSEAKK